MKFQTVTTLVVLSGFLSACTGATFNDTFGLSGVYNWGCNSNKPDLARSAKWDKPIVITEAIKDKIYQNGILNLKMGAPHIIEVTNLDDQPRSFRAERLFANSSILKVVHKGVEQEAPCLQSVTIEPNKTSEIHLVPQKKGYYDYYETYWTTPGLNLLPIIAPLESVGIIYVN